MKIFRLLLKLMLGINIIGAISIMLEKFDPTTDPWWYIITVITWFLYVMSDKEPFKD